MQSRWSINLKCFRCEFLLILQNGVDARQWPVREECLLTVHTFVSLLKAWKVTVVGIECDDAAFQHQSRRSTQEIVRKKLNSVCNVAN